MDNLKSPLVARSLVDEIVQRLERAIMTGELSGGTLIREQKLARSLGVSRGPLREAIRRLEGRKLLQRTPNVGAKVLDLSTQDLREVWVIREALEGMASGLAAVSMTKDELAALDEIIHNEAKSLKAGKWSENYQEPNSKKDFHHQIVLGSRNERLIQLITGDLRYILTVYRYKWMVGRQKRAQEAVREHRDIVAALKKRDPALAEKTMRQHIRNSMQSVLEDASDQN
jgi:DNA-binding GntR family transcriptional regulator